MCFAFSFEYAFKLKIGGLDKKEFNNPSLVKTAYLIMIGLDHQIKKMSYIWFLYKEREERKHFAA